MKTHNDRGLQNATTQEATASRSGRPGVLALFGLGAALALIALSGCASGPFGGTLDSSQYNTATGYPAVGNDVSGM